MLLATIAFIGTAAGCAGAAPADVTDPAEQIATYKTYGSAGGFQALNSGTLILHNGCLYTGSATYETDGVPLTLVIFPRGFTTWDGTTLTVGDESWQVGETVHLGGSTIGQPGRPYELHSSDDVPESCVVTDNVWSATAE